MERLDQERAKAIKDKGGLPFLGSIPVGESKIQLQLEIPTDSEDPNGNARNYVENSRGARILAYRRQFVAKKKSAFSKDDKFDPEERLAWTVNPRSPLYRELITQLANATGPIDLVIVRTGTERQDTRYSIKKA